MEISRIWRRTPTADRVGKFLKAQQQVSGPAESSVHEDLDLTRETLLSAFFNEFENTYSERQRTPNKFMNYFHGWKVDNARRLERGNSNMRELSGGVRELTYNSLIRFAEDRKIDAIDEVATLAGYGKPNESEREDVKRWKNMMQLIAQTQAIDVLVER